MFCDWSPTDRRLAAVQLCYQRAIQAQPASPSSSHHQRQQQMRTAAAAEVMPSSSSSLRTFAGVSAGEAHSHHHSQFSTPLPPSSSSTHQVQRSKQSQQKQQQVVIVDVCDANGRRQSVEVRRGDNPSELADRYAASTPGGITPKQRRKLVDVIQQTLDQHLPS